MDDTVEKIDGYLFLNLGFTKQNAWAGPDHWKYQKAKGRFQGTSGRNQLIHFGGLFYGFLRWNLF